MARNGSRLGEDMTSAAGPVVLQNPNYNSAHEPTDPRNQSARAGGGGVPLAGIGAFRRLGLRWPISYHAGSHPVSFLRFDEQEISFSRPSDYQVSFCGTVLEIALPYLASTAARMQAFTGSKDLDTSGHSIND